MHFNWEHPKYIKSIEIGNVFLIVPKGILFRRKRITKKLDMLRSNTQAIDKVRQKQMQVLKKTFVKIYLLYNENYSEI